MPKKVPVSDVSAADLKYFFAPKGAKKREICRIDQV